MWDNKGADHMRNKRAAGRCLCFRCIGDTARAFSKSEPLNPQVLFVSCYGASWFAQDLFGSQKTGILTMWLALKGYMYYYDAGCNIDYYDAHFDDHLGV